MTAVELPDAISRASKRYGAVACLRCEHVADRHSCDDSKGYDITDPATPFRCNGPNFDGCAVLCPDFLPALTFDDLLAEEEAR